MINIIEQLDFVLPYLVIDTTSTFMLYIYLKTTQDEILNRPTLQILFTTVMINLN